MRTYQHSFWSEQRVVYQMGGGAEISSAGAEAADVTSKTHSLLEGLKNSIALPSETVGMAAEKVALTGLAALNIAFLGGVFASGIYMIVAGKPPPFLRKFTGKES